MKLILGAYNAVGADVLKKAVAHKDVEDVALYTHPPAQPGTPDVGALGRELDVWTTEESLNEAEPPFRPDVISLVYYRHIVSDQVIASVDQRIFNLHPSLLPRHRGASSVPWAIIEGDSVTGVTYHYVTPEVDGGDVLLQLSTQIEPSETQASLYSRLMELGAAAWGAALALVLSGWPGVPQHGESCRHPRGAPNGGEIDPSWDRLTVERFIRAMHYPPLSPATLGGEPVSTMDDFDRLRGAVP